jgi:Sugar (and other) transporter
LPINRYVLRSTFVGALGGLLFGFDTAVISGTTGGITRAFVLGPVYIAELAPPQLGGRLVGTFQINIVVGILLAYLSNYLICLTNLGLLSALRSLGPDVKTERGPIQVLIVAI